MKKRVVLLQASREEKDLTIRREIRETVWEEGNGYDNSFQVYSDEAGNIVELEMETGNFGFAPIVVVRVSEHDNRYYIEHNKVTARVKVVDGIDSILSTEFIFVLESDIEDFI